MAPVTLLSSRAKYTNRSDMLHLPILRKGEPYQSIDVIRTPHHRTREMFVEISQANAGLIRRDLLDQHESKSILDQIAVKDLIEI